MANNMNNTSPFTFVERIESLKAGILSGSTALLTFLGLMGLNYFIFTHFLEDVVIIPILFDFRLIIRGMIAFLSGFLFGITYRYVVRSDDNPHLGSGAVLAFGLVRGLGELDAKLNLQENEVLFVILVAESILLFAVTQVILDLALKQGWVKSFNSN
ncbi:MAG: hypothetical protein AAFO04_00585 [Cyanobacteria bacterium J06592_8]